VVRESDSRFATVGASDYESGVDEPRNVGVDQVRVDALVLLVGDDRTVVFHGRDIDRESLHRQPTRRRRAVVRSRILALE